MNHLYTWHKTLKTPAYTSSHSGYRYLYDSDGLLTEVESPKNADGNRLTLKHHYDKNGREIEKVLQNGHLINYQYNNRGLLTQHAWNRNHKRLIVSHQYDADGRLVKLSDSDGQSMHYRYTPKGQLLEITYPDNRSILYTLDDYDRVISQQDANQTVQHFFYNTEDKGRLSSLQVNGSRIDFHYGEDDNGQRGQLVKRTTSAQTTGVTETYFRYGAFGQMVESTSSNSKAQYSVSYNQKPRGELFKQVQKLAKKGQSLQQHTTEYRYDGMQRLTNEVHTDQTTSFQKRYHYDGNNNLRAEENHSNCGPSQSLQYSYNNLDQLISIRRGDSTIPILHDINGRLTQDHKQTKYEYDDAGFLLQVQPKAQPATHYEYWPNGLLSRRSTVNSQSHFYPDHHQNIQTVLRDGQWRSLVRHGKNILGRQTDQSLDQFFKVNESTGAVLQQNKGETQLQLQRYDAYGKPLQHYATDTTDFSWDQELNDPHTELTYLRHRFHNPELRRFITRDSKAVDNRYAFAHSDPINYIDPTGHNAIGKYVGGSISIALSLMGLLLAIPSAGASLGFSAAGSTASTTFFAGIGLAGGVSLIGLQAALDAGNKSAAQALAIVDDIFKALAGLDFVAAVAPKIIKLFAQTAIKTINAANHAYGRVFVVTGFDSIISREAIIESARGAVEQSVTGEVTREEYMEDHKKEYSDRPSKETEAVESIDILVNSINDDFVRNSSEQHNNTHSLCSKLTLCPENQPTSVTNIIAAYEPKKSFEPISRGVKDHSTNLLEHRSTSGKTTAAELQLYSGRLPGFIDRLDWSTGVVRD